MSTPVLPYETAETIRLKKSQYCRFADTHEWDHWRALFHPSVKARFCNLDGSVITQDNFTYSFDSVDELVSFFSKSFETQQAIHVVGPGELVFTSEEKDEVSAVWPMIYHAASHDIVDGWSGTGGGHYHEIWRVFEGEWVIAELKYVRGYFKMQGSINSS
ncbi:hypothetical protein BDV19DRAFT_391909 [Aspergillus venezuelensis]